MRNIIPLPILLLLFAFSCTNTEKPTKLFSKISKDDTGINFRNLLQQDENFNIIQYSYFYNGAGVGIGDINNDGLEDIIFTGNMVKNRLYLNKGNLEFEDITQKSKIAEQEGWCTGVTLADVNQDGFQDIYICRSGYPFEKIRKNLLYINNGDLTFTEKAAEYNLDNLGYSTQASFFDYDNDGDLDVFIANQSTPQYSAGNLEVVSLRRKEHRNMGNRLYENKDGKFYNVSKKAGIFSNVLTFSLGLNITDINNDGWQDIFVGNDFNEPDYLFINNQNGTFTDKAKEYFDHISFYSMGSDVADFNNDGLMDLISLDMLPESNHLQKMHMSMENFDKTEILTRYGFHEQYMRNMLQVNNGNGTFSEVGQIAGVSNTDWSWAPLFADLDNDGFKDLFVTNGYVKDYTDLDFIVYSNERAQKLASGNEDGIASYEEYINQMPDNKIPNYIYQNMGGMQFSNKVDDWGLDEATISQGAAFADLDNDGDLDLIVNNTNDYAHVYRNNSETVTSNNYIKVKLNGPASNPNGIGTKVYVHTNNSKQFQEQNPVRGYQSSVSTVLNFGLGKLEIIDSIVVQWPDNLSQTIYNIKPNQLLVANQENAREYDSENETKGVFTQKEELLDFKHKENNVNDFKIQPLIPHYLSRSGPCIAKADINNDNRIDLFIGGAKGQPGSIYLQTKSGQFKELIMMDFVSDKEQEDTDALFFDANGDGYQDLYVVSGGYDYKINDPLLLDRLYLNDKKGNLLKTNNLPNIYESGATVTAADIDYDGDIDLFVGSRLIPGNYPETPNSFVLINNGDGIFNKGTEYDNIQQLGMVTDAEFVDLNNDKKKELVIVGEWMPIKVFEINNGKFKDQSDQYISFKSSGWWNKILTEDIDKDGDQDLIVGNQGLNSQIKVSENEPACIYYGDFDNNNSVDPILCYYIQGTSYPMVYRDDLLGQLAPLKKKFKRYSDYADATIKEILSKEQLDQAKILYAHKFESILLKNNNGTFKAENLPELAQISPVYAMTTLDYNNDGIKDLLVAGNNTNTRIKLGSYDANHGILLEGRSDGSFIPIDNSKSGIKVKGNVRFAESLSVKSKTLLLFGINDSKIQVYESNNVSSVLANNMISNLAKGKR